MEVEITVRVRAIIPDGLHLPRLAVDTNLPIPLKYMEGMPPNVSFIGIDPKILTVQHAIRPTPEGGMWTPLDDALNGAPQPDAEPAPGSPRT